MSKLISLLLTGAGVVLLIFGARAYDSISSDFSRFFTDSPTDKAIWLLISGLIVLIIGLSGLRKGSPRN